MTKFSFRRFLTAFVLIVAAGTGINAQTSKRDTLTIFNSVRFYDGYQLTKFPEEQPNDGILRHRTYLYAVKLTEDQLNQIGDSLEMHVSVQACCDNYDRIGNINLAFVPKGQATYTIDDGNPKNNVPRIEIGRFITPFMDKNKKPDTVPYFYSVPYLSYIFHDSELRAKYDIWVEFELFGVPYAAQSEITGCAGRSDVFLGTLKFSSLERNRGVETDKDVLVPINMKIPQWNGMFNLNNYTKTATDTIGKTVRTFEFEVPKDVASGQIVLVTSNHGAGSGGEEYNRRWHYVYYDDELMMTYKPGRFSCEPFRKYNTQANGIYGFFKKSNTAWQSSSNWCPGDVIDNRIILLGAVKAGKHKVRISVPDAKFNGNDGDIPVSIFFQGLTEGEIAGINDVEYEQPKQQVEISMAGGVISAKSSEGIVSMELRDLQGKLVRQNECEKSLNVSGCPSGIYLISVELMNGITEVHKIRL